MRKLLATLPLATGLLSFVPLAATAAPAAPISEQQAAAYGLVQPADWYCGPRCQYWQHRRWEEHQRWEEGHRWHDYNRWRDYNWRDYNRYGYGYYRGYP